jgi:hypothetical protein
MSFRSSFQPFGPILNNEWSTKTGAYFHLANEIFRLEFESLIRGAAQTGEGGFRISQRAHSLFFFLFWPSADNGKSDSDQRGG